MRPIPKSLLREMLADKFYAKCCMPGCGSIQVEFDHVWIIAGRQLNEKFAILPLCYYHHRGGGLDRPLTQWISLQRATEADLAKYPKKDWATILAHLEKQYGKN